MIATRIAAFALVALVASTAQAFAQSYDALNPLAVRGVAGANRRTPAPVVAAPATDTRARATWQPPANSYEAYLVQYQRWYAAESQRKANEGGGFMKFLSGISATLSVSDQALSVYEHSLDARALNRYYNYR